MAATVHGKLQSVIGTIEGGSVEIALCGYGSFVPRSNDAALVARPTSAGLDIPVDATGKFSANLTGNDLIDPAGTYYTVTVKDANGDIVQCSAYLFTDGDDYDLNTIDPIDTSGPPLPPRPPILDELEVLAAAANMVFDGTDYTSFETTLVGAVDYPSFVNMVDGNLYTFIIIQDGVGSWDFVWAGNVFNAMPVDLRPNFTSIQTFVAKQGSLYAIAPGTYYL